MAIIITYDVPSKHTELKKEMATLGYTKTITNQGKPINLPNTTLYHPSKTADQALADIKSKTSALGIKLERCVATIWESWAAIWGDPLN
ncbi:hypothetical protein [Pedobacter namyangjuensis]|uniref:hypothetical protein n=1 Tax=Pedobacter namyangjuensis TaxID=600626 RepID=UPI000DE26F2C|nr:hypothetical protein [Pedobacter namyangjuensis]